MHRAPLHKIIPFSSVDGPGNRTAIFFQGCNFNCTFCHNPETITMCIFCGLCVGECPTKAISLDGNKNICYNSDLCCECDACIKKCQNTSSPRIEWITPQELFEKVEKYLVFVDGITVSGGESTLWHEFLTEFFQIVKFYGKTTFVDSNGYIDFREMEGMVKGMDKAMIDIKSTSENEHKALTGKSCIPVLENVKYLAKINKLFEIRTVIIPNLLDNERNVTEASKLISYYKNIRYKIIKYRQYGVREDILKAKTPTDEYMEFLKDVAIENGVKDIVIV